MTRRTWHTCQPVDLFSLARRWFLGARRIEMQKLAGELGISRATAYRWAGSVEQLVGEVLASIVDDTFARLANRNTATGRARVLDILEQLLVSAARFQPLRQFLSTNPQMALKVVASRDGPVHARTVANVRRLLDEAGAGGAELAAEPAAVAYALTRVLESYLYFDLVNGDAPDLRGARKSLALVLG